MTSIGDRAREAREELGLTVGDVWRRMRSIDPDGSPSRGWLPAIENHAPRDPGWSRVDLLARVLNVAALWLFRGEGPRERAT